MASKKKASKTPSQPGIQERHHERAPAERWQHGDHDEYALDEARPKWRVQRTRTAADLLLARGDITMEQHNAATRYRRDHERGLQGSSLPLGDVRVAASGNGLAGYMDMRVGAVHSLRQADQALGDEGRQLLLLFVVHGLSFLSAEAALEVEPDGPLGSPGRKALKEMLAATLDRLAQHYSGALYRPARPRLEPEVAALADARVKQPRKALDMDALQVAVNARIEGYGRIGATPAAVAALLRAEFGSLAERVLEAADA